MKASARVVCLALLIVILPFPWSGDVHACGYIATVDDELSRGKLNSMLHTLWTGDLRERRRAVQDSNREFELLAMILGNPEHELHADLTESIHGLLLVEEDDFTLSILLDQLAYLELPIARSRFLDALSDESPNVRRRAYQWFAKHEDPEALGPLEDRWDREEPSWSRINLISALACQGYQGNGHDLLGLARSEDEAMAASAIRALGQVDDWRVIPLLKSLLRSESESVWEAAVSALARKTDSLEAFEILAEAARTGHPRLSVEAIDQLDRWDGEAVTQLMLEIATSPGALSARVEAMEELWIRGHDDLLPIVETLSTEVIDAGRSYLEARTEVMALRISNSEEWGGTREMIGNSRETAPVCEFDTWNMDTNDPPLFRVAPPAGMRSVRCWASPAMSGDPKAYPRIPANSEIHALDLFEVAGDVWLSSWIPASWRRCWVLRQQLEIPPPEHNENEESDTSRAPESDRLRVEFDALHTLLETEVAAELREAGALQVIEPGAEVVGFALEIDLENEEDLKKLFGHFGGTSSNLDNAISKIAIGIAPLYRDHPELVPSILEVTAEIQSNYVVFIRKYVSRGEP